MSENEVVADGNITNDDDLDAFTADFLGGKKAETPDANQDAEQEVEVSGDQGDAEAQTTDDEVTDEDEKVAEEELKKPKSKVQERIDELVRQAHEAKRAAKDEVDAVRKELEAKIEALTAAKTAPVAQAEPTPDALNEDGTEKYPLGEFDPNFIKDLTKFTLNQERAAAAVKEAEAREAAQRDVQAQALHTAWTEKVETFKAATPDFAEKGEALLAGFNNLNADYANYLGTVIMSMDFGPQVLYYLSDNPDEATKIVNSGAQKATLALGRIEAKFAEADAQKLLAKPKISKAPPPPSATARGTGGGTPSIPADTDDLDAFTAEFFRKKR